MNKSNTKRNGAIVALIMLCLTIFINPQAAQATATPIVESHVNLEKPQRLEKIVSLDEGGTGTLVIEPVLSTYGTYPNASGQWHIYWNSPITFQEFYIYINNSNITRAWGSNYSILGGEVTDHWFDHRSKWATQKLSFTSLGSIYSTQLFLKAQIKGTTLYTWVE